MASHLSNLNIASISDIHLVNPRNHTKYIIDNLLEAFPDNSETAKLNIIFICGDVFDRLISLSTDDIYDINTWISKFLRLCKKHNIILRILKGTPSHDFDQSRLFSLINELSLINANVKYINELSIENITELGINVLYIPDEWESTTDKTYQDVLTVMAKHELPKVDFTVMHGQFEYQLPPFVKAQKHNSEQYLNITKELIFVGHVHTYSKFNRIIAQGSFDRLSHGEEEAKGHVRVYYDSNGDKKIKFIENVNAKTFKTINCSNMDIDEILECIHDYMTCLQSDSHIRIEAESTNPIFSSFDTLVKYYPFVTWTKLPRGSESEELEKNTEIDDDMFIPISITKDNIVQLLMDKLNKVPISETILNQSNKLLLECI